MAEIVGEPGHKPYRQHKVHQNPDRQLGSVHAMQQSEQSDSRSDFKLPMRASVPIRSGEFDQFQKVACQDSLYERFDAQTRSIWMVSEVANTPALDRAERADVAVIGAGKGVDGGQSVAKSGIANPQCPLPSPHRHRMSKPPNQQGEEPRSKPEVIPPQHA